MAEQNPITVNMSSEDLLKGGPAVPAAAPISVNMSSDDLLKQSGTQVDPTDHTSQPGWFQGAVQDILSPLAKIPATVNELGLKTQDFSHSMFGTPGLNDNQKQELATHTYDMGALMGNVKVDQNPWEAVKTGAEIASYVLPEAEGAVKAGETAVKSGWQALWGGAKNLAKAAMPFAGLQTAGSISGDIGQGKSATDIAANAMATFTGTTLGFMTLGAAGNLVKTFAGKLLQNQAVQVASKRVVDLATRMLNLDPAVGGGTDVSAKAVGSVARSLQKQATDASKALVDATAEAIKAPATDASKVLGTITDSAMGAARTAQKDAAEQYGKVMSPNIQITPEAKALTFDALDSAKGFIDRTPELRTGGEDPLAGMGSEAFRAANADALKELTSGEETGLQKYMAQVQEALGTKDAPKAISLQTIDNLHMLGMNTHSTIPQENTYIKDIATSLYQSAKDTLAKAPDTSVTLPSGEELTHGQISDMWTKARQTWLNFRSTVGDKFYKDVTGIGHPAELAQEFLSQKAGPSVSAQTMIDGLSPQVKSSFSDMLYNNLIDQAKTGANYVKQGADLEKWLDGWENSGILKDEQVAGLRGLSDMMQKNYADIQGNLKQLLGGAEGEMAPTADKAVAMEAKSDLLDKVTKGIGNRDLFTVKDGKYDFSNMESVLNSGGLKNEPSLDPLRAALAQLKDITTVAPGKLGTLLKAGFGGGVALAGHPWIGGSIFLRNASKLMGKDAASLTGTDVGKFTADLAKGGQLTPGILTDIITGRFDLVEKALTLPSARLSGSGAKKVTEVLTGQEE